MPGVPRGASTTGTSGSSERQRPLRPIVSIYERQRPLRPIVSVYEAAAPADASGANGGMDVPLDTDQYGRTVAEIILPAISSLSFN